MLQVLPLSLRLGGLDLFLTPACLHAGGSLDRYPCIPEQVLGVIVGEVLAGLDYLISLKVR